jgi:hypothetical protein
MKSLSLIRYLEKKPDFQELFNTPYRHRTCSADGAALPASKCKLWGFSLLESGFVVV